MDECFCRVSYVADLVGSWLVFDYESGEIFVAFFIGGDSSYGVWDVWCVVWFDSLWVAVYYAEFFVDVW